MTDTPIAPERQRLDALKATMPMRDDLGLKLLAAWCGVTVDQLPEATKQHDNPATFAAWTRVADVARAALEPAPVTVQEAAKVLGDPAVIAKIAMIAENIYDEGASFPRSVGVALRALAQEKSQ